MEKHGKVEVKSGKVRVFPPGKTLEPADLRLGTLQTVVHVIKKSGAKGFLSLDLSKSSVTIHDMC